MSTGLIIVIVLAAVLLVALPGLVLTRGGRFAERRRLKQRRKQAIARHEGQAETRTRRAEAADRRARIAAHEAERERAEAQVHKERAALHERGMADHELTPSSHRSEDT
jgi:C4-dicarboxylate-specific signal transduction histidine kinase